MEKTQRFSIYWIVYLTSIIVSVAVLCSKVYDRIKIRAYDIFEEVVNMDIDMRLKNEKVTFKKVKRGKFSSDSTYIYTSEGEYAQKKQFGSNASNKYNLMQQYLSDRVPMQVSVIDSLFQIGLFQAGIPAETVVKSIGKSFPDQSKDVVIYSKDIFSVLLYVSLPVKKMEMPVYNFTLSLQGFIQCPFGYLLKGTVRLPFFWFWILGSLIALCWLILYTVRLCVKKKTLISPVENVRLADLSEPERVVESETIDVIKPLQPATREWLSVTDKILLDETTGDIKFDGEIVLRLKGLNLKLFVCFVKNINVCVGFVQLKTDVWNNSDTYNSTISIQVKKLEKELQEKIPVLSIENIHGKGYCLTVSE